MRRGWSLVIVLAGVGATAAGASCGSGSSSSSAAALGNIDDQLMHTPDSGIPVLLAVPNANSAVAVLYDPTLNDPITHWGGCMEQFRRCFYTAPLSGRIVSCVNQIQPCPSADAASTDGSNCCPAQCIADFNTAVDAGASDPVAVNNSVGQGSCVPDFTAFTAEPVSP